jgi:hypothetical protein
MSPTSDSPFADFKRFGELLERINGGLLVALVIVGFFLVMILVLPEGWPLFAILLGIGAVIAFRLERREAQGYPDKMDSRPTDIEADGRPQSFGPDMQMENNPTITAHPIGLVMAIGLGLVTIIALPESRLFILSALALGGLIGLVLRWKHR